MSINTLQIDTLDAHPDNPRMHQRQDVIDSLAAKMRETGFDEAHAIIVRPIDSRYQVISGHHRVAAAAEAGLTTVPAWVRDMPDDEAFMALVLCNTHGELTPLERGIHALKSGLDVTAYATRVGRPRTSVSNEVLSARVASAVTNVGHALPEWTVLREIHAAPSWLWPALVAAAEAENWTVERVRKAVAAVREAAEPPPWINTEALAKAVVSGEAKAAEVERITKTAEDAFAKIASVGFDAEGFKEVLTVELEDSRPARLSEVMAIVGQILQRQTQAVAEAEAKYRDAATAAMKVQEEAEGKAIRLQTACTVEEWKGLDAATQQALLSGSVGNHSTFNKTTDSVEWASWTWNPVTGCNHGCPYCYARVIATSGRTAGAFPNGFKPTLCASRLAAPRHTKVPGDATFDERQRNVFVCSMADLFGRWVPNEWIEAVLREARNAPQWNFLCLTKFPKRMAEFDIPENVWMGTSIDLQARVAGAEAGFANVKSKVRWISVEPMIEPLKFNRLDLFDWIVIGGASKQPATADSPATPEWFPPFEWIADLVAQARAAGVKVYFKTNLLGNRILEMPSNALIKADPTEAPDVFHYLAKRSLEERPLIAAE